MALTAISASVAPEEKREAEALARRARGASRVGGLRRGERPPLRREPHQPLLLLQDRAVHAVHGGARAARAGGHRRWVQRRRPPGPPARTPGGAGARGPLAARRGGVDEGRDPRATRVRSGSGPGTSRRCPASPRASRTGRRSPPSGWCRSAAPSPTSGPPGCATFVSATTGTSPGSRWRPRSSTASPILCFRERINHALRARGFVYVALDLEPFRSGRLNEAVGLPSRRSAHLSAGRRRAPASSAGRAASR